VLLYECSQCADSQITHQQDDRLPTSRRGLAALDRPLGQKTFSKRVIWKRPVRRPGNMTLHVFGPTAAEGNYTTPNMAAGGYPPRALSRYGSQRAARYALTSSVVSTAQSPSPGTVALRVQQSAAEEGFLRRPS
jgi:hypothetical protein